MLALDSLESFVAIAETGSVARAAERLHISASPLSRKLLALEAQTGLQLFAREKQRLRLTRGGAAFLVEARRLLAQAARLEAFAKAGAAPSLSVGFVPAALHAGWVGALARRHRGVHLELEQGRSSALLAGLRAGAFDVVFTHARAEDVEVVRAAVHPFLLALPADHALARGRLELRGLDGVAFIGLPAHTFPEPHARMMAACANAGFAPRQVQACVDPLVALRLVEVGVGFAFVQEHLRPVAPPGVRFRRMPRSFDWNLELYELRRR